MSKTFALIFKDLTGLKDYINKNDTIVIIYVVQDIKTKEWFLLYTPPFPK